jgi:hypothetical protein
MTSDRKKLAGRILLITSILVFSVNLILYATGRGLPGLTAMGALFFILAVAAGRGSRLDEEGTALLGARVDALRRLSYIDAAALPEARGEPLLLAGRRCELTTFRQPLGAERVLVTVQLSTTGFLGGWHRERGLVFHAKDAVREASDREMRDSGG